MSSTTRARPRSSSSPKFRDTRTALHIPYKQDDGVGGTLAWRKLRAPTHPAARTPELRVGVEYDRVFDWTVLVPSSRHHQRKKP
ncbi:hypothetical protein BDZ89DRAFT_1137529 [Hymenopellis radicata]|nr:hypothetical protein BDZ89DRAFT_1137529 [Hymenopellis radicata]